MNAKVSEIESYFKSGALNQSYLTSLLGNPRKLNRNKGSDLYYEEKSYFLTGSLVDCKITTNDLFDYYYYVDDIEKKPSGIIMSIFKELYDLYGIIDIENQQELLVNFAKERGYTGNNWSDEVIYKRLSAHLDYYYQLDLSKGKQIISIEEDELADKLANSITSSKYTYKYFQGENSEYQKSLYWNYEGYQCKGLIDFVVELDDAIYIVDIKTTSYYLDDFYKVITNRNYDFQLFWYKKGYLANLDKSPTKPVKTMIIASSRMEPEFAEPFIIEGLDDDYYENLAKDLINRHTFYLKEGYDYNKELVNHGFNEYVRSKEDKTIIR